MKIIENCPLYGRNTFGMDVKADCIAEWSSPDELRTLLGTVERPYLLVGGGSNLLFTGDFKGTILQSRIETIDIVKESQDSALKHGVCNEIIPNHTGAYAYQH